MTTDKETTTPTTYSIIRYYKNGHKSRIMETDLSLGEAAAWCNDPETSSRTATSKEAEEHTKQYGEWFDGFIED